MTSPNPFNTFGLRSKTAVELPRASHIIDIENLTGSWLSPERVTAAWASYAARFKIKPGDAVMVGCGRDQARHVAFRIPSWVRLVIGERGADAADRALIDHVDVAFTARRYKAVVIGSADGAFAPLAAELGAAGCAVYAAVRAGQSCSTKLRLATSGMIQLSGAPYPAPRIAA